MCSNREIAHRMLGMGWDVVLGPPGKKIWGTTKMGFDYAYKDADANVGIFLDGLVMLDCDRKIEPPNEADVLDDLMENYPEHFENAIIERTGSGGYHVYYRAPTATIHLSTLGVNVGKNREWGRVIGVHGTCYSTCAPSRNSSGDYKIISKRNFLNTRPEELQQLPEIFTLRTI